MDYTVKNLDEVEDSAPKHGFGDTQEARFALDGLKIDRSFIAGLAESPTSRAIFSAVVRMAAELGLEVTAEGVETEEQVERLRALGCERAQGYLFGWPATADGGDLVGVSPRSAPGSP